MEIRELTCIGCPVGCQLTVEMENGAVLSVTGNSCKIGDNYARKEVVSPRRIVTSTVAVLDASKSPRGRISVKTASDVPKEKIIDVMREIHHASVHAPVHIGDVVIADVAGTGISVIATKDYEA